MDQTLRMYAIMRGDLKMSPGKLASQAGHAFVDAYDACLQRSPHRAREYIADGHGTKVVLSADTAEKILEIYDAVKVLGIPCALIVDSGHIMPPYFDGNPIVTAVGIGPVRRDEIQQITNQFDLVR